MIEQFVGSFGLGVGLFQERRPHLHVGGRLHVDGMSLPDRYPVVNDDFDPSAKPEPEMKNSRVFFVLAEALVLRNHLQSTNR